MVSQSEVKEIVRSRAGDRCEYCQMHQSLQGATFHVEHIVPRSAGGTNDPANLAWACPSCNLHKSDRIRVSTSGSNESVLLFNPRTDLWTEHFEWDDYSVIGKTQTGRATVRQLDLNHERRQKVRQAEQLFGLFPPDRQS